MMLNAKKVQLSSLVFLLGNFLCTANLYGELSSKFLRHIRDTLKQDPQNPVPSSSHFSEEENGFIKQTHSFNYADILAPAKTNSSFISYGFWNQAGTTLRNNERSSSKQHECHTVFTSNGVDFDERPLNALPDEGFTGWSFSYCAGADLDADDNAVLYFFHGALGSPDHWLSRLASYQVRDYWRKTTRLPKWVSVSVGRVGHLAETDKEQRFFDTIVPYLEKHLDFSERPKIRFGLGLSQGGANIVHILLKQPSFFNAAAAACPAISSVSPSASPEELLDYKIRTLAWSAFIRFAINRMPSEFRNLQYWQNHVDPLVLGQKLLSSKTAPFYLQTNSQDQFGFQEGGQLFALLARTKGANVEFEEIVGSHCVISPQHIANFFTTVQKKEGELPHS